MGLGIPPLGIQIVLESSHLKPTMLVGGLGVSRGNHLSYTTRLTQVFFNRYEQTNKLR